MLEVAELHVEYRTPAGPARAVNGVSFTLHPGERLGLVGESGSGKSTTALALLRMIKPPGRIVHGHMRLEGRDLLELSDEAMRQVRFSRMALIPQGAMSSLNPVLRVRDQIEDLLDAHDVRLDTAARRRHIALLMRSVGMSPSVADVFPHELSGGMKQRICIAMSVALQPVVIIADEPTSALDVIVQKQVLQTLGEVQSRLRAAIILVGHDMGLMAQFVQRIGVMYAGRLVEVAPVRDIFARPRHPYTAMLIASLPSLRSRGAFRGIPGISPSLIQPPPGCPFHPRCDRASDLCRVQTPTLLSDGQGHETACHHPIEVDHAVA
ncbi:MAG: ABC transporter ATP-binding protein [Proteobacteria bacterium]|nr:ABC transporter ATP-binding protein [Pseudomonadota bacterium]